MLALDRIRAVHKTGGALFVETQLLSDPKLLRSTVPLWQFFPRDSLNKDGTNKWAPNRAGLVAVVEESLYRTKGMEIGAGRGYLGAIATEDKELSFFRALDSARGWWGRKDVD
jgi:hypothetical protein